MINSYRNFLKNSRLKNPIRLMLFWLQCSCVMAATVATPQGLPSGFVYLKDIDPSIIQDIRYAGYHNFVGHPISGYKAAECILTRPTALALARVQQLLKPYSLSLKVYDCYRPQLAVNEFIAWSRLPALQQMKAEFYPRVNKVDFFKLGYVAAKSGHSRGSTVDLTLVALPLVKQPQQYSRGQKLRSCFAAYSQRFYDGSLDMGTGFDCLDPMAHFANVAIHGKPAQNRLFLKSMMEKQGFAPYPIEWWHFTLRNEPFPDTYFSFPVLPSPLLS